VVDPEAGALAPVAGTPSTVKRAARGLGARALELLDARELLAQLVRKELKVRYRNSALGFLWSMLTPALMTAVFSIVFSRVVRIGLVDFPAFFIVGYLLWQFLQNSSQGSVHAIVGNADLVKKVYFPREVLPLSHVLAQLTHFVLALVVVLPYLVVLRGTSILPLLPAALLVMALFALFVAGIAMWIAAANVALRDIQELFVVLFLLWFYASPILYPLALAQLELGAGSFLGRALALNPIASFVGAFRAPLYGTVTIVDGVLVTSSPSWPDASTLGVLVVWAVGSALFGWLFFSRRSRTFAREV
jgi:ABC-type polysaccharide/polyol phosphate export permease